MKNPQSLQDTESILARLDQLNEIGVALSKETDTNRLLEAILVAAHSIG
jgi:hypothetical protein